MALTAKEKNILRMIIAQENPIIARRMKDYTQKSDEEVLVEIDEYKIRQADLINQQRIRLNERESEISDGGEPAVLPEG